MASVIRKLADSNAVGLILTTGAVGYMDSDCAPDALCDVADKLLPGIPEALRAYNIRHTKKIILDRSAAGIRKKTLIINLPESAKMAKEDMEYILPEVVQTGRYSEFMMKVTYLGHSGFLVETGGHIFLI